MKLSVLERVSHIWLLVLMLSISPQPLVVQAQEGIHLTINKIDDGDFPHTKVYLTATDASGLPIVDLEQSVFMVSESGQPVSDFTLTVLENSDQPISVVLAIDTSDSMNSGSLASTALQDTKEAATTFVTSLGSSDQAGLVTFSSEASEVVSLTADKTAINAAIEGLTAQGETALYDAIVTSIGMLKDLPAGRKAIVLLADGNNSSSTFTFDQAIDEAARWSIPVYPIAFGSVDSDTVNRIAILTGGYAQVRPNSGELQQAFSNVLDVLRYQYVVEFDSQFQADGAQHSLVVALNYHGGQFQDDHAFIAQPSQLSVRLKGLLDGQVVGGSVSLEPEVIAPAPLDHVNFELDGEPLASVIDEPFIHIWDSTAIEPGDYILKATATDTAGNIGIQELQLTVKPPLTVTWESPAESGARLNRRETLRVAVESLAGVERVDYYLGDELLGSSEVAPYELEATLDQAEPGDHTLKAVVVDINNTTVEQPLDVVVPLRRGSLILWLALIVLAVAAIVVLSLSVRARRGRLAEGSAAAAISSLEGGAAILHELEGLRPGHSWYLADEHSIGRKRDENDIHVSGLKASRRHAIIQKVDNQYILRDLRPDNPSRVNGQPIQGEYTLVPGDTIEIGESVFRFDRRHVPS